MIVFLCTGFESLRAARIVIRKYFRGRRVTMFWLGNAKEVDLEGGVELITLDGSGLFYQIRSIIRFKKWLKNLPPCSIEVAYITHPYHFIGNYLFFVLKFVKIYQLPDGMINLADRRVNLRASVIMVFKAVLGAVLGIRYRPFRGHITGFNIGRYKGTVVLGDVIPFSMAGEAFRIEASSPATRIPCDSLLVLDQEIEELFAPVVERRLRASLLELVKEIGVQPLLYKAHPRGRSRFAVFVGMNAIELPQTTSIDTILGDEIPKVVVSYYSTALHRYSQIDGVRAIAVLPSKARTGSSQKFVEDMIDRFHETGVEVHRV